MIISSKKKKKKKKEKKSFLFNIFSQNLRLDKVSLKITNYINIVFRKLK